MYTTKYDHIHPPFPPPTALSHTQYIKPNEVGQEIAPDLWAALLKLCTIPCSKILQVKGEAILVSQYSFLLWKWIWGSNVSETVFQIKVIHSIYSLKYIKFSWLEKHTSIQITQCIMGFYLLSIFISSCNIYLPDFIYFGSKYSNKFAFSESLIAESRVGAHLDDGRRRRNCPEMEIHL